MTMTMPFKKLTVDVSLPMKFGVGDVVEHQKGGLYTIYGLPSSFVIEETGEPAYAYISRSGRVWVRSQSKMEDGRFKLHTAAKDRLRHNEGNFKLIDDLLLLALIAATAAAFWWLKYH